MNKRTIRRRAATLLAAAALAVPLAVTSSVVTAPSAAAATCGVYSKLPNVRYANCNSYAVVVTYSLVNLLTDEVHRHSIYIPAGSSAQLADWMHLVQWTWVQRA